MKRQQFNWQLPVEIERRLGENTYGRPRAICEAGQLLLVLQEPPGATDGEPKHLVFLRRADGKLLCNGDDTGEARLQNLLTLYQQAIRTAETAYGAADTAVTLFQVLGQLGPLTRASAALHAALQAARAAVPGDARLIAARDAAYDLAHDAELLLGEARLTLDYRMARESEAQAARLHDVALGQHKLNILAALTFPLMALSLLAGLAREWERFGAVAFMVALVGGLTLGGLILLWVVRPAGAVPPARERHRESRPRRR